jgi:hypothetical protein
MKAISKTFILLISLGIFFTITNTAQAASYFYGTVYYGVSSANYDNPESDPNAKYGDTVMIDIYNRGASRIPANIVSTVYSDSCGYFEAYLPAGIYDLVVASQTKKLNKINQCWIYDSTQSFAGARENCAIAFFPININLFVE